MTKLVIALTLTGAGLGGMLFVGGLFLRHVLNDDLDVGRKSK